ncbi:hypothetical protein [Bordetella hinzii]|uniref:hypothetical protein n=1 Tax=Bordetella hinzii TaxID=103855 RepID=UPI0011517FA2|nr:hypothetical protein [Bordetella hinzii]QDJ30858.1 hypothetical protein CBR68_00220 [Bordetella hinzii]QDJ48869.1 hypothetical protein CBR69_00220 [Bordetella hinzii]
MKNINVFLRDSLGAVSVKNMLIAPNIPEKKLNNAVKAFDYSGSVTHVIALFDNTLFGSGKEGLLFSGEQLIHRATFGEPTKVPYASIEKVMHIAEPKDGKSDKLIDRIEIVLKGGASITVKDLLECDYAELARVLTEAVGGFDDFKEEEQFVAISDMAEALKIAYLKIIVNMAYANDGQIDDLEFAEMLMLMTRLELEPESRFAVRAYMASGDALENLDDLIQVIDTQAPPGQVRSVHVSLVKDLINIYLGTGGSRIGDFVFLQTNRALLQVTDEEIQLALAVIENDRKMLTDDYSDDQVVAALKGLSAKAAAVGTPLAAVYLSGSVVGMSAAGMTSGLATLGMGGALGFSSMATGIGVAVLLGVGAYAGVRRLTGANELTRAKRRELMLNEIIKQTQRTISLLVADINYLTEQVNLRIHAHGVQDAQIRKLMGLMTQMTAAGTVLAARSNEAQGSATRLRCARSLDLDKLRSLTREPTKAELYDFIVGFYEERTFVEEKDGVKRDVTRLTVKHGYVPAELENLARAFEAVGYFNVGEVLKGSALDAAGKAKDKLAGLFS